MKIKTIKNLFFLFSLLSCLNVHAQWELQHPSFPLNQFFDLHFSNEEEGIVVGKSGQVMFTTDGGINWEVADTETQNTLYAVDFVDDKLGWAVGSDGTVVHTKNGGLSWRGEDIGTSSTFNDVSFRNAYIGCAIGSNSIIAITNDQGESWEISTALSGNTLSSIHFTNDSIAYIAGHNGVIIKIIIDEGSLIEQEALNSTTAKTLHDIVFTNETNGWVTGVLGTLVHTSDGGHSWEEQEIELPIYNESLERIVFSDEQTGWIFGSQGNIWHTTNGGENWDLLATIDNDFNIYGVALLYDNRILLLGEDGLFKSTDNGMSWENITFSPLENLLDVYFVNAQTGFAVGVEGIILKTNNGGAQWNMVRTPSPSQPNLRRIFFLDDQTGWVVGNEGTILRTTDGGEQWITQFTGHDDDLWGIHFPSTDNGWIVGTNNRVLTSTDNGENWMEVITTNEPHLIPDVYFTHPDTGWFIINTEQGGYVARTDNGSTNFDIAQVHSNMNIVLYGIQVIENTGWIVGGGSTAYKNIGAAHNWQAINIPGAGTLFDLSFANANTGWVAGGSIYQTTDGGESWETVSHPAANGINGIHFISEEEGWAVGSNGKILHYEAPIPCRGRDSLSLIAFKSALDSGWNNEWDVEKSMSLWNGVFLDEEGCVTDIRLLDKNIQGEMSAELGKLEKLRSLVLGAQLESDNNNIFYGGIPPEISLLKNLNTLNLSNTKIGGEIPKEMGKMTRLSSLNLQNCELSGSIPEELGNLSDLETLDLNNNQFSESIPVSLKYLNNLRELNLSYNNLEGNIPPEIGQLEKLTSLRLNNNYTLSGNIPPEIGQLSRLEKLFLNDNDLSGFIPPEMGQLLNLTNLKLQNNQLSGTLVPELANMVRLFDWDVRNNQLTGCYPEIFGLTFCRFQNGAFYFDGNPGLADFDLFCEQGNGQCIEISIQDTLCFDDSLLGFDRHVPAGRIHTQDSLITVNLAFETPDTSFIEEEWCWGSKRMIGGQWFSCLQTEDEHLIDQLVIADQNGCDSIINIDIVCVSCVQQNLESPPTAFTPNDDGINDTFVIPMLINSPELYPNNELKVFDAHSRLVYQLENYNNQWPGIDMAGQILPIGTYYYHFTYGDGQILTGVVSIVR